MIELAEDISVHRFTFTCSSIWNFKNKQQKGVNCYNDCICYIIISASFSYLYRKIQWTDEGSNCNFKI